MIEIQEKDTENDKRSIWFPDEQTGCINGHSNKTEDLPFLGNIINRGFDAEAQTYKGKYYVQKLAVDRSAALASVGIKELVGKVHYDKYGEQNEIF
jgi:hypothetical protein